MLLDMKNRLNLLLTLLAFTATLSISFAADSVPDRIPAAEFARIIASFSEESGYFISDNLISNEDGYLSVLKKMHQLHVSGGAYLGVGPEQNFTYIAKLRPTIAFLIDIRREAIVQHLMYKALFHLSKNRAEFLSRLLSRRLPSKNAPDAGATIWALTRHFSEAPPDKSYYTANLAEIERAIQSDFGLPFSKTDRESLTSIYKSFYTEGLDLSFQFKSMRRSRFGGMPSLRELLEQVDADGNPGNYLASSEDYQFVRDLHEKNRIIPIVGDFAGPKTLKSIAGYLRDHSCPLKVFYTSNVEMYLFESGKFSGFVNNVNAFPTASDSLFIRSAQSNYIDQFQNGFRMVTLLQSISDFKKDQQKNLYQDYWTLVNSHVIALR
jgi:hypothetical protein